MATIWMKSDIEGTFQGDRCVTTLSNVPASVVADLVADLAAEFADMGLALTVWAE